MSASTTPTFWPEAASAAARLTVTDDLPTPPFPLATAYTLVSEDGWANGICGSGRPPRSWVCRARRCSSLITSRSTRTEVTPGSLATAAVTSRVMVSRSGQPATVSHTWTRTTPSAPTWMSLTMPSSVMGRWISGSCTPSSALVTWSVVGGVVMSSCYEPTSFKSQFSLTEHGACVGQPGRAHGKRLRPVDTVAAAYRKPGSEREEVGHLAGVRIQDDGEEVRPGVEVEHPARPVEAARDPVEGAVADPLAAEPVVLDELDHGGLVGQVVADVVLAGPWRDDQQRQPRAVAAAVGEAAQRECRRGAHGGVGRGVGAVHDRGGLVVVPAVGVVVGDHDRRRPPERGLLDLVDGVDQEVLLVDRVGVAGVPVLVLRRLQVADRGQVVDLQRRVEVGQVVLVVGLVRVADREHRAGRQVLRVGGGRVVLERLVVRRVVGDRVAADVR